METTSLLMIIHDAGLLGVDRLTFEPGARLMLTDRRQVGVVINREKTFKALCCLFRNNHELMLWC